MAKAGWYERDGEKIVHIAYLDSKGKELLKLTNNEKSMLIRGAAGKKLPYGRVFENEDIYFIENNGSGLIVAKGKTGFIINSEKMTEEESKNLIEKYSDKLNLSALQLARWSGKKYLCLIEIKDFEKIEPLKLNRANNMDDWILLKDINDVTEII
jgi:hypothetical protein